MLEKLKRSLEGAPIVQMDSYHYFIHPITDGIPRMEPELLKEVLEEVEKVLEEDFDLLVGPEAMGMPLVAPLSLSMGKPYNIIRKRRYSLEGEVSVSQVTGYSECELYINGISEGDRVVLIDDVLSTGGTLSAIVNALRSMGVDIVDVVVVIEKGDRKAEIEKELDIEIKTLVKVEIRDGGLKVIN